MLLGLADTIRTLASMSSLKVGKAVILLHLCMVHGLTAEGDVSQREGLMAARKQDSENDVIVLVGGFVPSDTDSVETLRLDTPDGQEQNCARLPYSSDYVLAFTDPKGRPIACGGRGSPDAQQCYVYNSGAWESSVRTLEPRLYGSVAQLEDGRAFLFEDDSSEIYDPETNTFSPGPELPYSSSAGPCALEVPDQPGKVFITGGSVNSDRAYIIEVDTGILLYETSVPNARPNPACGLAESPLGGFDVVVAGGNYQDTVDVFNLQAMSWRPGTRYPFGLQEANAISFPPNYTSFLVIGGEVSGGTTSSVYEYVGLEEQWILRPELELEEPKCCMGVTPAIGDNLQCYEE